jgi:hypothetical protein
MDFQTAFNWLVPLGAGVFGWFMKTLWDANQEVRDELKQLRIHLPEAYVSKSDFKEFTDRVFEKLDQISAKLDNKADK